MGLGLEGSHPDLPGVVTEGISEHNQRGFYRRWAEYMEARSWDELALNRRQQRRNKGATARQGGRRSA